MAETTNATLRGDDFTALLGELEERLRRWGTPVADAFRPGAPAERVRSVLAAEGLKAPAELVAWFTWHDGAEAPRIEQAQFFESAEAKLVDSWHFISLADAVDLRRRHRDQAGELDEEILFPRSWFPILYFVGAAFLCIETETEDEAHAPLYIVDWPGGMPGPPPWRAQFSSLSELVRVIVGLFDAGVVTPDADDPRLPSLRTAPVHGDVARLLVW